MKLGIKEKFQSSHSLNAPPHITVLSPFNLREKDRGEVSDLFSSFLKDFQSFEIELKDFSAFGNRVIFIDVIKTEILTEIQSGLVKLAKEHESLFNYNYHAKTYHPHLTLAFKDLTEENFYAMQEEYKSKSFKASFMAESVFLLKHDGKNWQVDEEFGF